MKVLWLTSWYPSKAGFLDGDFIERHAMTVSEFQHVVLIYVVKYGTVGITGIEKERRNYSEKCSALIYYYPSYRRYGKIADVVISNIMFLLLHLRGYREYFAANGKPDGVLVQVGLKAGIIAL